MWGFYEGMWWWMVFGGLWMIVFWAALILLVVWLVNRFGVGGRGRPEPRPPSDIARERLARGEITPDEFDSIMAKLKDSERF